MKINDETNKKVNEILGNILDSISFLICNCLVEKSDFNTKYDLELFSGSIKRKAEKIIDLVSDEKNYH